MDFYPTLFFGFDADNKEPHLMQMWVDVMGKTEWRKVPMIQVGQRNECVAFSPEEADDA